MPDKASRGFDNGKYLDEQSSAILERVRQFGDKLYLEFGGKLLFDYHAARVLPGYDPNVKIKLLQRLKDKIEIIFCVSARDVAKGRIRGDFGMTYDMATLKTLDDLRDYGLPVAAVSINRFSGEASAVRLKNRIERRGVRVYTQANIEGYPTDVERIVGDEGYGKNPYIETGKPIVVITGAGPGSGKMATALQQMYHDHRKGRISGFAKWETFPIWELPIDHPVNVAYEAATADIKDYNMVDPFHLSATGQTAINYNRDVENFPILRAIISHILGKGGTIPNYRSPTDMGVNRAARGIVDDGAVRQAACQEIIRRYFRYRWEHAIGVEQEDTVARTESLMQEVGVRPERDLALNHVEGTVGEVRFDRQMRGEQHPQAVVPGGVVDLRPHFHVQRAGAQRQIAGDGERHEPRAATHDLAVILKTLRHV